MTARSIAGAILIVGFAAMLVMNNPGQLSYDSVMQLVDGRTGFYNSWHPPVMAWLLGQFDGLDPGTTLYLVFQSLLLLAAILLLLWLKPRGWPSVVLSTAIILTPQWLLYQGEIWKDILFANSAIAAFAALAFYGQTKKTIAVVIAAFLLALAASTRQNGLALLPAAGIATGLIASRLGKSGWRIGFAFIIATLTLIGMLNLALAPHTDHGEGASAELQLGQSYDLAGALALQPGLALPLAADPILDQVLHARAGLYSPLHSDPLAADPAVHQALSDTADGIIADAWWVLVTHHPLVYLRVRWKDFWAVLSTPDPLACHFVVVGVSGPAATLAQLGLKAHIRDQDRVLANYARFFIGTPIFSHLAWASLSIVLFIALIRRAEPSDLAIAGLLAGAVLFTLTFAIISIACDYRYLVFLDLSVMAAALYYVKKAL